LLAVKQKKEKGNVTKLTKNIKIKKNSLLIVCSNINNTKFDVVLVPRFP
jgi:hypothetical protein